MGHGSLAEATGTLELPPTLIVSGRLRGHRARGANEARFASMRSGAMEYWTRLNMCRHSAERAAPRPDTRGNMLSPQSGDLPVGRFVDRAVESLLQKYFCFRTPQITSRTLAIPPHKRGVS